MKNSKDRASIYELKLRQKYGYNVPDNKAIAVGVAILSTVLYVWWAFHCA